MDIVKILLTSYLIVLPILLVNVLYYIDKISKENDKNKKTAEAMVPYTQTLNFEEDIKFLHHIMDFKCRYLEDFIIETKSQQHQAMLTDKLYRGTITHIVSEVDNALSPSYMQVMSKYFDEDELLYYISQYVTKRIMKLFNTINRSIINKDWISNLEAYVDNEYIKHTKEVNERRSKY